MMRPRTALIALACAVALLVGGCSATTVGTAQRAGAAPVASKAPGVGGSGSDNGTALGGQSTPVGPGSLPSGPGSLPSDPSSMPSGPGALPTGPGSLPTGLGSLPTDMGALTSMLGGVPGVSGDCMSLLGIILGVSSLFIGPTLGGQPITQQQVDQAFTGMGTIPDELKAPLNVIHQAAEQAVGKSSAQALQILGSDQVSAAMDQLSKYSDTKCGGS